MARYQRMFMCPFSSRYCSGTVMRRHGGASSAICSRETGGGFMACSGMGVAHYFAREQFFEIVLFCLLRLDIGMVGQIVPVIIAIECEVDRVAINRGKFRAVFAEDLAADRKSTR